MSDKYLTPPGRPHPQRKIKANISKRNSQEAMEFNIQQALNPGNLLISDRALMERHGKVTEETKQRAAPTKLSIGSFPIIVSTNSKLPEPEFPPNDPEGEAETPISYPIIILFKTGHAFPLEVHATDTVADVKNQISKWELIPTARQRLKFSGRRLLNHETMAGINVKKGDILEFCLISNNSRQAPQTPSNPSGNESLIYLKSMEGRTIKLYIDLTESVKSLKLKIMDAKGIVPREQRLILNGQEMIEIDRSLESYGVHNESTIRLFQMLRGC
ncbi:unnamed protein product [Blepharisma stoltei]|uniref:Ubiquitin-like domain-containing protein n=1 Tax=Blepharisma stoltei TaxID=1481888 RepID=A0AAU9JH88_9CILI|nr:unnamed protein product [Blepharisma stoltei]